MKTAVCVAALLFAPAAHAASCVETSQQYADGPDVSFVAVPRQPILVIVDRVLNDCINRENISVAIEMKKGARPTEEEVSRAVAIARNKARPTVFREVEATR